MSNHDYVAQASVRIRAEPEEIWDALTEPDRISDYMFGTRVETDWNVGAAITWKGEWEGRAYEDKGEILAFEPHRQLSYSHYSPLSGEADRPENYHSVNIELSPLEGGTEVSLAQDNNATPEQRNHSQKNWSVMLQGLKEHVEAGG